MLLKLPVVLSQHVIPKRASRELEGAKTAASFAFEGELLELALTGRFPHAWLEISGYPL